VGNCLAASLLFCLSKAKIAPQSLGAEVKVELVRNERKRLRVGKVEVTLRPGVAAENEALLECLEMFEDFCVVTESVREGLDVRVNVVAARSVE
jgi:organic hydroperoxide reductase OsmC/OhrA